MEPQTLNIGFIHVDIDIDPRVDFNPTYTFYTFLPNGKQGPLFDLTGYGADMILTDSNGNVIDTLTVANDRIANGGTAGTLVPSITVEQMAAYSVQSLKYAMRIISTAGKRTGVADGLYVIAEDCG